MGRTKVGWRRRGICLLGMLLTWPAPAAETVLALPWLRQLGPTDGLPSHAIRAIAEDATGYLWLASSDGLLRFDGQRYRHWRGEDGLPDADLHALHIDADDRVWLGSASEGVLVMDADRNGFARVDIRAPLALRRGRIAALTSSVDGTVWAVGADRQLYALPRARAVWQHQPAVAAPVTAMVADRTGVLWVGTASGLLRYQQGRWQAVAAPGLAGVAVHALWADPDGGLQATTAAQTLTLDAAAQVLARSAPVHSVLRSADGAVWQQTAQGLRLQHRQRTQAVPLRPLHGPRGPPVVIAQALQDSRGDMWWVSRAHGLWRLPARWRQFTALPAARDGLPGPRSHEVLALAPSGRDRLWLAGSHGRLQRLDLRSGASSDHLEHAHAGSDTLAVGLAEDPQGRVWIASAGQLLRYDPAQRRTRHWPLPAGGAAGALGLQACADGSVWLVQPERIQHWSAQGQLLRSASPAALGLATVMAARPLLCAADGRVWAADGEGISRWQPALGRFLPVQVPAAVSGDTVLAIAEGADGRLWLSRAGAVEQYHWDGRQLRRLRRVAAAQGYPQVRAQALVVDADGAAWAGAARGLIQVAAGADAAQVLGTADGLPVQEVRGPQLVRLGNGALVAAVREGGLLAFDPRALRPHPRPPALLLEAASVHRQGQLQPLPLPSPGQPLSLSTGDRDLRLAVTLLGVADPDRIQHRFRLSGIDPDWVDTGPVAQRLFARLPAGQHVLAVQARHGQGPWSAPQQVTLQVAPAWWQRRAGMLAIGLCAALLLLLLARAGIGLQRRRAQWSQVRERQCLAEQESLHRTHFLTRLGSRIREPMCTVLGWSELLRHASLSTLQRGQVDSLHQAGQHLLQLVDDALDLASIESGRMQLHVSPFALAPLLRELHALLLPVARAKALALRWHSTLEADAGFHGDVQRLRQILLNLVGNALKFTAQGEVCIQASRSAPGAALQLCVSDTGPGMSAAQVQRLFQRFEQADGALTSARYGGTGLGLAISRELAQAMGGEISVDSTPGQGTRFTVLLPLPAAGMAKVPAKGVAMAAAPAQLRILLLLPVPEVAEVVAALLQSLGHAVTRVEDLDRWLLRAGAPCWDLIAADPDQRAGDERIGVRLPRLWPGVARLALSARADARAERDALAAGFDLFLRLPVTAARLRATLAACREAR